ncbi:helix-turn-helix transcriptional regulator [Actinoplanes sp. NPDC051470]|uniref:helix-turn-helix domain-containing protein n=1 Tax=Actinoplanes sp. NPDC051470 TaxID=3157224 RepID=UPI003414CF00
MSAHATARPGTPLTLRERECLSLAAEGLTNAEIAGRLFVSVDTVRTHLFGAYRRLGAVNRANAVFLALKQGVIQ